MDQRIRAFDWSKAPLGSIECWSATVSVIMLSARAGEESRVEGLEAKVDDYLIKPFSAQELLARVRAHLEITRVRNESEQALKYRSA